MRWLLPLLALLVIAGCAGPGWEPPPRTPAPAPTSPTARTLAGYEGKPVRLMVQEGAYGMQEKALQERDYKTLSWVWETYEYIDVPTGTRARVVQDRPSGAQVEIIDGSHIGRRGWMSSTYFQR